ncbi:ABC transporter permease, partial [Gemmatimonadota bacterium]
LQQFLIEGGRMSTGRNRHRLQNGLVVSEVILAVILLVGAGLTMHSFSRMKNADPGLEAGNVLTVEVSLPDAGYTEPTQRTTFFYNLLERIRTLPGVRSAATAYVMPLSSFSGWQSSFHVEGQPPEQPGESTMAEISAVSPDYFRTMGIPLLLGRDFTPDDGGENLPAAIVDERFAQRFWPDENPIGKRLKFGQFDSENEWLEVVGLVGHVKLNGVLNEADQQLYIPHQQDNDLGYYLVVKADGDPMQLVEPVRTEVLSLDASLPISNIRTLEDYLRSTTEREGFLAILLTIFASAALILASVGLYGVMSFATAERNHEIGIRMAMGARNGHVLGMVIRQGMMKVVLGLGIGLPVAAVVGLLLRSRLYGVTAIDPVTFILAPFFLGLIALAAITVPAYRASTVDPVQTLRGE